MNVLPHPSTGHLKCASFRRRLALAACVALVVTCCFSTGMMGGSVKRPFVVEPYGPLPRDDDESSFCECSYSSAACGARSASPFGLFRVSRRDGEDISDGTLNGVLEPDDRLREGSDGRSFQASGCSRYCDCWIDGNDEEYRWLLGGTCADNMDEDWPEP